MQEKKDVSLHHPGRTELLRSDEALLLVNTLMPTSDLLIRILIPLSYSVSRHHRRTSNFVFAAFAIFGGFCNQHDHVAPALKVSFPSAATGQNCQSKNRCCDFNLSSMPLESIVFCSPVK
jgi:hypothetical protein